MSDAEPAEAELLATACGPVEYTRRGDLPYVLICHGTPQGQRARFLGQPFADAGFGTILPSRPGYLRTPLAVGRTPVEQADAMAALLDALGVERAAVYALSGGGPCGVQFAARHPNRAAALILESAVSAPLRPRVSSLTYRLVASGLSVRLLSWLVRYTPTFALSQLIQAESTLDARERARQRAAIMNRPEQRDWLRRFAAELLPMRRQRIGFDNDLRQFRQLKPLPFAQVRCPTLVVHGTHDRLVPFSHAETASGAIAGAVLHAVDRGWHLLPLALPEDAFWQAELAFLRRQLRG